MNREIAKALDHAERAYDLVCEAHDAIANSNPTDAERAAAEEAENTLYEAVQALKACRAPDGGAAVHY